VTGSAILGHCQRKKQSWTVVTAYKKETLFRTVAIEEKYRTWLNSEYSKDKGIYSQGAWWEINGWEITKKNHE
jgi:hypothetical protein